VFVREDFAQLAEGSFAGIPYSFLAFLLLTLAFFLFLKYTKAGHNIYVYGSNTEAGYAAGINMPFALILTYAICGVLASVSGIFLASKIGAGSPVVSDDACLLGMTAIIIGGNKLSCRATLGCTLIGVLTLGVLNNMMNLLRTMAYLQTIIRGLLVVLAMAIDAPGVNKYFGLVKRRLSSLTKKA
jgi:ribose/xylose/arabinose/galactoside ABC-type transport system permease subunit